MVKKIKNVSCCGNEIPIGCCKVESLVSIDERGQMILPKEIRERAGIKANDKLALMSWEKEGKICCISMIKAEELGKMAKGFLGPLVNDIFKK